MTKVIKYIPVEGLPPIDSLAKDKLSLSDENPPHESIWIGKLPGAKEAVLLNHALAFYPFESWGCLVPTHGNVKEMKYSYEFRIHAEAYQKYLEAGIINAEGEHLKQKEAIHDEDSPTV